jgi:hypothetical protein
VTVLVTIFIFLWLCADDAESAAVRGRPGEAEERHAAKGDLRQVAAAHVRLSGHLQPEGSVSETGTSQKPILQ